MRICPYLSFNGNCAEVIALYEKAFGAKAEIAKYKDVPSEDGYQLAEGTENLIMHAGLEIGGAMIMLSDMPPEHPAKIGGNVAIMVEFDDAGVAKNAFDVLKEGGEIDMELQETFWSKCFGSLTDKYGVTWNITIG